MGCGDIVREAICGLSMFALLDGNNFYVNCEQVFKPSLKGRPVVVLSNNDGCVISRSEEAKAIGIKMAQPAFECKQLFKRYRVAIFSANFPLYGNMSQRMMGLAAQLGFEQEVYSIDECFMRVDGIPHVTELAKTTRHSILQGLGLPTCIGIAPTKTLAKFANLMAKQAEREPGSYPAAYAQVCNWSDIPQQEQISLFKRTPIGYIWGVGKRTQEPLIKAGIRTIYELMQVDLATLRKRFSVTLERTVCELQGMPCIELDTSTVRKQVACTRSFSAPVTTLKHLQEAISDFASKAAYRLRLQKSVAGQVYVFIHTSAHRKGKQAARSLVVPMQANNSTQIIAASALCGLNKIYSTGYDWVKAGVILLDLQSEQQRQTELCFEPTLRRSEKLAQTLDTLQHKFGAGCIAIACSGATQNEQKWRMRQQQKSHSYTTNLQDLARVS